MTTFSAQIPPKLIKMEMYVISISRTRGISTLFHRYWVAVMIPKYIQSIMIIMVRFYVVIVYV